MRSRYSGYDKQYKIDTPFNYVLLLGISLFFWLAGYIGSVGYPVQSDASATPLWRLVCRILPDKTITYLVGIWLTVGGAFLIHRANYVLAIIREKTLMPFFLYILFISSNPGFFPLNSTSPAIFCLILAFYQLFTSYHDSGAVRNSFNSAFFIGAGSLFWVHILWFLPICWWGMYNFKVLSLRTFLASLTGVGVIYWFLLGWCVWHLDYTPFTQSFALLPAPGFPLASTLRLTDWIYVLYAAFLVLISIVHIFLHEHEDSLRTRQYLYFLILFFIASFCLFLLYQQSSDEFLGIICMPFSILLSHFFTVKMGKKMFRLYYVLLFFFIVLSLMRSPWISLLHMVI
ncbi:MAG: DUF6427 family protein [Tannerellaceae bacterium]|jgi:hypothetical protein|nr:DUF6427 family protein [Tannerellaceae bacterium]